MLPFIAIDAVIERLPDIQSMAGTVRRLWDR